MIGTNRPSSSFYIDVFFKYTSELDLFNVADYEAIPLCIASLECYCAEFLCFLLCFLTLLKPASTELDCTILLPSSM